MKVGIIGPSNFERVAAATGIGPERIREMAAEAGRALAASGHEIVVVPDQGVPVIAAKAYREAGGKKAWGLIPSSGHSAEGASGRVKRHSILCHETERDLTWHEQHSRLVEASDALLCVGISCGTICEIAWTKWTKKIPVFVLQGLGSRVPAEIEAETDVRYVASINDALIALNEG